MGWNTGMPAKSTFSDEEVDILVGVVRKHLKRFRNQTELAKAIDITQPSLSSLLSGKWSPGLTTARHIAELERVDLEHLLPNFRADRQAGGLELPNLEKCLSWHEDENRWSSWTVACARAGVYGDADFQKAEWVTRLDALEKTLDKVRKGRAV